MPLVQLAVLHPDLLTAVNADSKQVTVAPVWSAMRRPVFTVLQDDDSTSQALLHSLLNFYYNFCNNPQSDQLPIQIFCMPLSH